MGPFEKQQRFLTCSKHLKHIHVENCKNFNKLANKYVKSGAKGISEPCGFQNYSPVFSVITKEIKELKETSK